MKILAHRGFWKEEKERNSLKAFEAAFERGFGIETDVRDYGGELVISHDIADVSCERFEDILKKYESFGEKGYLGINIKSDGLREKLNALLRKYHVEKYFVFDMSIPEMIQYRAKSLIFFTRHSDIEKECVLYDDARGIWMDSFFTENWMTSGMIERHLTARKLVGIISPEIHGFDKDELWRMLKESGLDSSSDILLCTDKPEEAEEYFCIW